MIVKNINTRKVFFILFFLANLMVFAQDKLTPNDRNYTGIITEEDFRTGYTQDWFIKGFTDYKPNAKVLKKLKKPLKKHSIKVFMGTWCPDSRREVPKLLKILDEVGFKEKNIEIYAMDHSKSTKENYEANLDVHHVPTLIFFDKKGNEVNRFVEFPIKTIEKDILKIVTDQSYKNPYEK
ncbi:TlpA family protein disulfide reductase [Mesonia aestuariivivens]|uniref:Thioredoxin family protein n=1 Tax=Mesonia aestuariivivens TaxID=2796128 RepID=A0ABS6VZB0_9FLAO|nr:thioredoxin family protein [Mesonia aestuariivivens]MBW2960931.1 thioredoxin family protein [Mesonia aestuariivivens]